jgi:UPF0716 protein FxsA
MPLLLLFIGLPILEIYLIIHIGHLLGAFNTIALIIITAILGITLLRTQGLQMVMRAQHTLQQGELPTMELMEGVILLVSGALLLTPGFFTDTLGFLGLIPLTRQLLIAKLSRQIFSRFKSQNRQDPHTIEGKYWKDEP